MVVQSMQLEAVLQIYTSKAVHPLSSIMKPTLMEDSCIFTNQISSYHQLDAVGIIFMLQPQEDSSMEKS